MAETLQKKVACDTCATSDVKVSGVGGDMDILLVVLECGMGHRTEVWFRRKHG